jgi:hypothetical protein
MKLMIKKIMIKLIVMIYLPIEVMIRMMLMEVVKVNRNKLRDPLT